MSVSTFDLSALRDALLQEQVIGESPQYWSAMPSTPKSYTVTTGTALTFKFSMEHNLYLMETKAAYDSCDLAHSVELAGEHIHGGEAGQPPNLYEVIITTAGTYYMSCHIPGHCESGQKIEVTVENAPSAPPPAPPPSTPPPDCGGGCIGALLGGTVVFLLALVALALYLGGGCGAKCPSPLAAKDVTAKPSNAA